MSRTVVLNIVLGVIVVALIATLVTLETRDDADAVPSTTTTTSTVVATTTTSTTTTTTSTTTTTTTSTTTTSTVPPSTNVPTERFFVGILVVNGTSAGQRLAPVVQRLTDIGYFDVRGVVGAVQASETTFYHLEGFRAEAEVVAVDLGFDVSNARFALFDDAPPVSGIGVAKVIVYLGGSGLPEPVTE